MLRGAAAGVPPAAAVGGGDGDAAGTSTRRVSHRPGRRRGAIGGCAAFGASAPFRGNAIQVRQEWPSQPDSGGRSERGEVQRDQAMPVSRSLCGPPGAPLCELHCFQGRFGSRPPPAQGERSPPAPVAKPRGTHPSGLRSWQGTTPVLRRGGDWAAAGTAGRAGLPSSGALSAAAAQPQRPLVRRPARLL